MHELLYFVIAIFTLPSIVSAAETTIQGFSVDLIHRDSPLSPFYDPSLTPADRLRIAAHRSAIRSRRFRTSSTSQTSTAIETILTSDYLMRLSIGTPPVEVFATADTGSDLVWLQCEPCLHCYPQDTPVFNSAKSHSYKALLCNAPACRDLFYSACVVPSKQCAYYYHYGDRSLTVGLLGTETVTFKATRGSPGAALPGTVFGCGLANEGIYSSDAAGLVGLGGGPLSLVSQLGPKIGYRFSYCLVASGSNFTSKLSFGKDASLAPSKNVISTPLTVNSTFYVLSLESVSVGGKRVSSAESRKQGIVIDSGSTLTSLETKLYKNLEDAVRKTINRTPVKLPSDSQFSLCYKATDALDLPDMVFNFGGLADVVLKSNNTFVPDGTGNICMAIEPATAPPQIFGYTAQVNFHIVYDIGKKRLSFAPTDCAKQ